ncbi:hypothetical protein A3Q56_04561 [Intoshia linei]|uniref:NADH dehydrogenase [ubiquinone] 1 alpha subcomplex subunit 8 n=1 Tax=Intoshia linei TaxID=1819745 RepID=A0A177B0F1_9BILA|nr:hypothetical protein A3Q56_04561 [Intoshia linei]
MTFTDNDNLPTYEELDVPDLYVTSAPLRAVSMHMGKKCDELSKEYMLCTKEEKDPRICLEYGKMLTACGNNLLKDIKKNCAASFTKHWKCLDDSEFDMRFKNCRKSQLVYDTCVKEKLNLDRPKLGYFCKFRTHKTTRPKPTIKMPDLPKPRHCPPVLSKIDKSKIDSSNRYDGENISTIY